MGMMRVDFEKKRPFCKIDFLAFTLQLRELLGQMAVRELGVQPLECWLGSEGLTPMTQNIDSNNIFNNLESIQSIYDQRLLAFFRRVLGVEIGHLTCRGFHGYTHSFDLLDHTGEFVLGRAGLGGNNGTLHVQLTGRGCKYVLQNRKPDDLHRYFSAFGITSLKRLDLAVDDHTGQTSCASVRAAFHDGKFYQGSGRRPQLSRIHTERQGARGIPVAETVYVGSRPSRVFWRTYDKNAEQKITAPDTPWYRHEAELHDCSADLLLELDSAFCGTYPYASEIYEILSDESESVVPVDPRTQIDPARRAMARVRREMGPLYDLDRSLFWLRRHCGRALNDLLKIFDPSVVLSLISSDKTGAVFLNSESICDLRNRLSAELQCPEPDIAGKFSSIRQHVLAASEIRKRELFA